MDGFDEVEDNVHQGSYDGSMHAPGPTSAPFDSIPVLVPEQINRPTTLPYPNFVFSTPLNDPLFALGLWQDNQPTPFIGMSSLEPSLEPLEWPAISETQQSLLDEVFSERFDFQNDPSNENTSGQLDLFDEDFLEPNFEPFSTHCLLHSSEYLPSHDYNIPGEMYSSTADMVRSETPSSGTLEHSCPLQSPTPQKRPMSAALVTFDKAVQLPFQSNVNGSSSTSMVNKRRRSLESEQSSYKALRLDGPAESQGIFLTLGKRIHSRRTLNEQERKHTSFVRDHGGACLRCRRLKLKCWLADNPYESCTNCKNQKKNYKIPRMPCFQSKIIDSLFFRSRPCFNTPLEQKRKTLFELADFAEEGSVVRTVKLTQDHGEEIEVYVSRFIPAEGDKIAYEWKTDKGPRRLELPPYCLTNIDDVKRNVQQYVKRTRDIYLAELSQCQPIISLTINMAVNYTKFRKENMLSRALEIWSASRIIEKVWRISGEETLGISITADPTFPRFNTVPITPIMDTQMDQIVIQHVLEPLRLEILEELEQRVALHKPETFFETYLTVFALLCNIERTTINEASFARRYGIGRRFPNLPLLESYFHSARILLSHFHFVCHGFAAIQSDWTNPAVVKFARLDSEQQEFMKQIKDQVNKQENNLRLMKTENKYDNLLYWSHQLFFVGWQPGGPIQIQNELE